MAAILSDAEVEAYFKEKKAARKTGEFGAPNYETIMKEVRCSNFSLTTLRLKKLY